MTHPLRTFFSLLLISLASLFAVNSTAQSDQDRLSIEQAQKLSQHVLSHHSIELKELGIEVQIRFDQSENLPAAYARWIKDLEVAEISVDPRVFDFKELNQLSFTLMLCHELGHFLGGEPYVSAPQGTGIFKIRNKYKNMSTEGQADYFASSICFPKMTPYLNRPEVLKVAAGVCEPDDDLCIKVTEAIHYNIELYRKIINKSQSQFLQPINILNRTRTQVQTTIDQPGAYPSLQCRAHTLLNGYQDWNLDSQKKNRPRCWFKK